MHIHDIAHLAYVKSAAPSHIIVCTCVHNVKCVHAVYNVY